MEFKAKGTVWKNKAGYWEAKIEVAYPNNYSCFSVGARKKMKDAMFDCNIASKKLGWIIEEWTK